MKLIFASFQPICTSAHPSSFNISTIHLSMYAKHSLDYHTATLPSHRNITIRKRSIPQTLMLFYHHTFFNSKVQRKKLLRYLCLNQKTITTYYLLFRWKTDPFLEEKCVFWNARLLKVVFVFYRSVYKNSIVKSCEHVMIIY